MNTFSLSLCGGIGAERFDSVMQFVAADDSGSFGILPHHEAMVAVLRYGLARFMESDGRWHYLALPGGVMRFCDNAMTVVAARYFIGTDRNLLVEQLAAEMTREDSELHAMRATLAGIERTLMRRLNELGRQTAGVDRR